MAGNEARYFEALHRIMHYQSPERMRRDSQKDWGLDFEETLEYAYENVLQEARNAIKGRRHPNAPRSARKAASPAPGGPNDPA